MPHKDIGFKDNDALCPETLRYFHRLLFLLLKSTIPFPPNAENAEAMALCTSAQIQLCHASCSNIY